MSIKSKVLAAAATLTMVGGLGAVSAAGALSANAATPSCGPHYSPNYVLDVFQQRARVGQPIILYRTSNTDPAEDFTISAQGTVADFYAAGLASAALNLHYANDQAYEVEYTPYGAYTGLCMGVATTAMNLTPVSLQPCGVSSKTLWVVDSSQTIRGGYVPLINGSDTNFSNPFVLHYPGNGYPTDIPRPQLNTYNLQRYSRGQVFDNEMWGANFGRLR
jgi:hypothetical protein